MLAAVLRVVNIFASSFNILNKAILILTPGSHQYTDNLYLLVKSLPEQLELPMHRMCTQLILAIVIMRGVCDHSP